MGLLTLIRNIALALGRFSFFAAVLCSSVTAAAMQTIYQSLGQATILSGTVEPTMTQSSPVSKATQLVPIAENMQPCNGYVELCIRGYGNITYVAAHNSPFVQENSAAANQNLGVSKQLNDGIRMLQGQTHDKDGVIHFCHTSCDLLDAGPMEDYLKAVVAWLEKNPFEVITILIGNSDFLDVSRFNDPLVNSGIFEYAYIPPGTGTLNYNQWPTLGELILMGKQVVLFMDYKASESRIPFLLDEFAYVWETPFSPTTQTFPCTIDRPPNVDNSGKMYLANHNLNAEMQLFGQTILIPDKTKLNTTNAVTGFGSLGLAVNNCKLSWGRSPNFLLVDFYEVGGGSVFEVAAQANNLPYNSNVCCSQKESPAASLDEKIPLYATLALALAYTLSRVL